MLVLLVAPVLSDLVVAAVGRLWPGLSRAAGPRPLRALIRHAFVLAAVLPILVVSTVSGEFFSARQHEEADARLNDTALSLADRVNSYVDAHVSGVAALAAALDMTRAVAPAAVLARQARSIPISARWRSPTPTACPLIQPASVRSGQGSTACRSAVLRRRDRTRRVAISDVYAVAGHRPAAGVPRRGDHRSDGRADRHRARLAAADRVPVLRRVVPDARRQHGRDARPRQPRDLHQPRPRLSQRRRPVESAMVRAARAARDGSRLSLRPGRRGEQCRSWRPAPSCRRTGGPCTCSSPRSSSRRTCRPTCS